MPVNYDPANSQIVQDVDSIGKQASNESERRKALQYCMENSWAEDEIGRIERVENSIQWGWIMYSYIKTPGLGPS